MAPNTLWLGAAFASTVLAVAGTDDPRITPAPRLVQARQAIAAVEPTESGQIGINPVSVQLGDPDDYLLTYLVPDHPVLTWDGTVYHVRERVQRC
jgi:hypothetical protein